MIRHLFPLYLLCLLVTLALPGTASARDTSFPPIKAAPQGAVGWAPLAPLGEPGASAWVRGEQADVRLIAARTAVDGAEALRLGLQFDLKPGWKVYWRSPGDAGYPPSVDWAGSDNLGDVTVAWPAPHRFDLFDIQTAGYDTQVVLPLTATVPDPARPVQIHGVVDYLICSEICIPGAATVELTLPAAGGAPSEHAHLIERYQSQVPSTGQGIALEEFTVAGETLRVAVTADPPLEAPDLFVEGPLGDGAGTGVLSGAPKVTLADGGRRAVLTAKLLAPYTPGEGAVPLTVTVVDGGRGLEATATPVAGAALVAAVADAEALGLGAVLGLALLGGLILNLMPCVLPVLSLKVMGFVGHGGAARGDVRAAFLASAAGIVASFLLLAAVLAGLKMAGTAVGWGIQFQQPLFLIGMIALLTLFAANLWGFFEVPLPAVLSGAGGGLGAPRTLAGHFTAGAFATLLATPCSAPFLGTAVGFALARGPLEIGLIFAALGVGMALPYLAIAAAPALAQRLPRPGRWMLGLRAVLGVALAGTAVWLLVVLMAQIGVPGAAVVGALMAAVVAALALRHRLGHGLVRPVASAVVILLIAGAFAAPVLHRRAEAPVGGAVPVIGLWQPWSQEAVADAVAAGKVVLVDVTADWCITCKVNKAAVLERGAVLDALRAPTVVAMKADWTNPDPVIAAYLASFGRYGIPFNAVYGPAAPEGIPLPELLSTEAVLEALSRAAGTPAS
ncbi:protein-disulfide reductase DsbD family protein [Novispirillum sp. DQ9]|uniref:protein-disulfide reductase DsbD family protein n=1 Tax=Novispirillum sp. DQ9 TaxID=3398612 RepID=UPI003C7AC2B7